jgi:hypothetical protein
MARSLSSSKEYDSASTDSRPSSVRETSRQVSHWVILEGPTTTKYT